MGHIETARAKELRGNILDLLRTTHDGQHSHLTSSTVWNALVRGLGYDVTKNEVTTMLQDLGGRGYVTFQRHKNEIDGNVRLLELEITPKGRDLLEGTIKDPAVEL